MLNLGGDGESGTFELADLHAMPYCSGAARAGSLRGCYRKQ
jgi:hypothetical protein